jgi:sortase (surface protein transpeptidase)
MVATGLLLSITVLVVSEQPWGLFPRTLTGHGRPHPQPSPVAQKARPLAVDPAPRKADQQVADPVRLRIPTIGVDAPVDPLAVDKNGVLPPPETNERTGWWRDGPEPGERGPAVIVGHIDSYEGPAVFIRLADLRSGDQILIDRADGSTAMFVTQRVEQHAKDDFPTQAVYGATPDPQLRLITCGGDFDDKDRRYLDNVIVYANRSG